MSKQTNDTMAVAQDEKEAEDKEEQEEEKVDEMAPLQQLFYFCKRAEIDGIKQIRSKVSDINAPDEVRSKHSPYISRNTAMHYAVLSGSLETVQVIYNLEAQIDSRNKLKSTPLHIAASLGYTEIVKYLIEVKADIEATNVIGNTPLHCAVYAGHVDTVQAILDASDNKQTALLQPTNAIDFGAVKYTAHEDMKAYLKQFFPKKKGDNDKTAKGDRYDDTGMNGQASAMNGNDVHEEEDADEADETTGLTSAEQ